MPTGHVPVPGFPGKIFHKTQVSEVMLRADGEDRASAFCHRQIAHSHATDGVLINTVEEFEPTGLGMLQSSLRVPVWPIGPLIRVAGARLALSADKAHDGTVSWLDTQPSASVLYVSFGSQNSIRQAQMAVLARALEHTGRPFIWAIRPPVGLAVAVSEWLPEGFEKRARDKNRGLVVRGWAPRVRILAHRSTCAFLSHCGWNSVLESLLHGVPLLGWPLAADQFYNVEMLERECGVCVEVARGNREDAAPSEIDRVTELVETVMGQTSKAAKMRRRMKYIGELMRGAATDDGGSLKKALEGFVGATRMH
uniref:Cytokinin-O-glucosyltransferase 1 n=1 Tax=Aegilops tauschii TaxID=37682 RepID=M8C3H9_AEGTA